MEVGPVNMKPLKDRSNTRLVIVLIIVVACWGLLDIFWPKETLPSIVYRIAIDETWCQLKLYDKEEDITLFSKEIVQTIAEKQHFFLNLIQAESDNLFVGLDSGEYDGVLSSFLIFEDDVENYISSDPYYLSDPYLLYQSRRLLNLQKI